MEEFELTEEMETAAEGTEPGLWVGWWMGSEVAYFREEGGVVFIYVSLRCKKLTEDYLSDLVTQGS